MKRYIGVFLIFIFITPAVSYAAGESQGEQLLRAAIPSPGALEAKPKEEGEFSLYSYFEPSKVVQGSRPGRWREITNRVGYKYRNIQGYAGLSQWSRFDVNNYTANIGSYINFPNSYAHVELGWGWDITYMHKFQSIVEYGRRIKNGLFWQAGYNFRHYQLNDNYIFYPGLIYYFGDNYVSADYGLSITESRNSAQFGTLKANFALGKRLSWLMGTAIGERLYDIFELPARKQFGYIIFTGLQFNLCQAIAARVGFSYGTEKPDFIKRGANVSLSIKF